MELEPINGNLENDRYCHDYEIRMECHQGFAFPDGSTEQTTKCVHLDGHKAEWSFLASCYPRKYLNFNIIKSLTDYSKTTVNGIYPLMLKESFNLHIIYHLIFLKLGYFYSNRNIR